MNQPAATRPASALTDAELDGALEGFQRLEDAWGWEEAVNHMLVFDPLPDRVRRIGHRACERATESRVEGNTGEERRFLDTAESLSILAERIEQQRRRA